MGTFIFCFIVGILFGYSVKCFFNSLSITKNSDDKILSLILKVLNIIAVTITLIAVRLVFLLH